MPFSTRRRRRRRRRIRRAGQRRWSAERLEPRLLLDARLVINEIHYDPDVKTEPVEFIELYNAGDTAADMSGWTLGGGIDFTFPQGSQLGPGQFLVVAQDPAAFALKFGIEALGPFDGRLANEGEEIVLYEANGTTVHDRVDYGAGFPWPTVGEAPGASIQLLNPSLDNDLAGSWRSGVPVAGPRQVLFETQEVWRYFKGQTAPPFNWRSTTYNASQWATGQAPIGYGEPQIVTVLDDMPGGYTSVYLRRDFMVDDPELVADLLLEVLYDDGIVVWINGTPVVTANVPGVNLAPSASASSAIENDEYVPFLLQDPSRYLRSGRNVIAVHLLNSSLSGSSDAYFDARLTASQRVAGHVTPGAPNSVLTDNAPPQLRQVRHSPQQPGSGQTVTITAKATDPDGVQRVVLHYQLVQPGDYIPLNDPRYENQWTTIVMRDDGTAGDEVSGDDVYTVRLPGELAQHRHLVRYRIQATDTLGNEVLVPYADDPQPNFAYFVYDEVPSWTGAVRPGVDPAVTYDSDLLTSIPVYHLITTRTAHEDAMFIPNSARSQGYTGSDYLWYGTFVYDGQVYDHVTYRARGGVWRYAMGKNMWKFNFHRGHRFQAYDNNGNAYATEWDKLNFSAIIQQGDYLHRGEHGLFEAVSFKLFNLAGVEAPNTHYVHFRIIESENEQGANQYSGDFQGLYLVIEQPDGRMLDEHGLPDGNFYKMEAGTGTLNNQGPTQPSDRSDLDAFLSAYTSRTQSEAWWRENLDLERYYSYRAIVEAVHHYDIGYGKNYFYYHNPETGKWQVHPWDVDLTWADNMFGNGEEPFNSRVARRAPFIQEYRNRLREIRDLLYNEEQTGWLIDEIASVIYRPGEPSWVDADRAMWDYNPILRSSYVQPSKAGNGRYYQASETDDFAGMIELMKDYVRSRGAWIDATLLTDRNQIPAKPTIQYAGPAGHPLDRLEFQASPFQSSSSSFAGMQWRIAEVYGPGVDAFDPSQPLKYEITPAWQSEVLTQFQPRQTIPSATLQPGRTYRARVRMLDASGRWSHWSDPVEFVAGAPVGAAANSLRISEIYYHPPNPTTAEQLQVPNVSDEDFEFLELVNLGAEPIPLAGMRLEGGVEFSVDANSSLVLAPGQTALIVSHPEAFAARFGDGLPVIGTLADGRLSNGGDTIRLVDAATQWVLEITYDDGNGWPVEADGDGPSLQLVSAIGDPNLPENWEAAAPTPGQTSLVVPSAQIVGHHVFYNGSRWDDHDPDGGPSDDQAIASDKQVLLPGSEAAPSNYTSHPDGITGLMIDIQGLADPDRLSPDDFRFRLGNSDDPTTWPDAPDPLVDLRRDVDGSGFDRIALRWQPATLRNTWLEVTLLATPTTGLNTPHTFYFGSLVGDVPGSSEFVVDDQDVSAQRSAFRWFLDPAAVDDLFDHNRDGLVDGTDLAVVRDAAAAGKSLARLHLP